MSAVGEVRTGEPVRAGRVTATRPGDVAPSGRAGGDIRVPRLLVTSSEISWRLLVVGAAVAVVVYLLTRVSFAVVPCFVALMLATLLAPPARALMRRGVPPAAATSLVFVGGVAALALLVALLVPPVVGELSALGERVRGGVDRLGGYVADLPLGLDEAQVQREIDRADERITSSGGAITSGVMSGAQVAARFVAGIAIMLVLLFFFIKDGPRLWSWALRLFPSSRREMVDEMGRGSWDVLSAYVRGVAFVAAVDAIGIAVALTLIGVPLVVPLAALTFFAAFIPVVGAWAAGATAALVALVSGGPVDALLVAAAVAIIQQLEGSVLYPMIIGRTMELHPIAILLAVTVGGVLAGIIGAAVAVPIAAMAAASVAIVRRHTEGGEVTVQASPPAVRG